MCLILTPTNPKANVLIDKNGHARLTDLGLASVLGDRSVVSLLDANLTAWMAPEISEGGTVTKEGDAFMFAMVAVEVRTRGIFEGGFSTYFPRTDVYRAFPVYQILHCCVEREIS